MRVLITAYVRFGNALAWHALEVCRGLHAAGHQVSLLCQRNSPLADWSRGEAFPVNSELNLNRFDPREMVSGAAALRRVLRDFEPDVLNPHCPPGHTYLALARNLTGGKQPLIRTVAEPRPPKRNIANRRLHEKLTDGVVLTTESSRRRYSEVFTLDHAPVKTILPGFRARDFVGGASPGGYRNRLALREDHVLAGLVARMSPEKGQEVLLEALSLLETSDRERIHCIIAGQDSRQRGRADLEAIARRLGVERYVTFVGPLDDVRPLLAELDLGIITSTSSEAICRVALEYMSFGVPVAASDVNILPEVVRHGENGWIFPNRNARALAGHLRGILHDPDERKRRGARGRELVSNEFSLSHEIGEVLAVYEEARGLKAGQ